MFNYLVFHYYFLFISGIIEQNSSFIASTFVENDGNKLCIVDPIDILTVSVRVHVKHEMERN